MYMFYGVVVPIMVFISYRYPYILLIISAICILCYLYLDPISWARMALIWLRDRIEDPSYTHMVNRYLAFLGDPFDENQAKEIMMESISYATGANRMPRITHIGETAICPISLEEIHSGQTVMVLPCGHRGLYIHMSEWIQKHHTCPTCRQTT